MQQTIKVENVSLNNKENKQKKIPVIIKPEAKGVLAAHCSSTRGTESTIHYLKIISCVNTEEFEVTIGRNPGINHATNDDNGHITNNTTWRKWGVGMPQEVRKIYKERLISGATVATGPKIVTGLTFSSIVALSGLNPWYLLALLSCLFILDWFMGLIPGNQKEGREGDYEFRARLWEYLTYLGAVFGALVFKLGLVVGMPGFKEIQLSSWWLPKILVNFDWIIIASICAIYLFRLTGYVKRQSKMKFTNLLPKPIREFIDKNF